MYSSSLPLAVIKGLAKKDTRGKGFIVAYSSRPQAIGMQDKEARAAGHITPSTKSRKNRCTRCTYLARPLFLSPGLI